LSTHIFGIRHHGPGCARSLRLALEELQPDIILVEGPSDAHDVLPLLIHQDMQPPVALLIYAPDKPHLAAYYPFTSFSPEWQALSYGLTHTIPTRFIDLPQAIQLARRNQETTEQSVGVVPRAAPAGEQTVGTGLAPVRAPGEQTRTQEEKTPTHQQHKIRTDPIALLAEAAGYTDHDLWWEHQIEQRRDMTGLFASILEAMSILRAEAPAGIVPGADPVPSADPMPGTDHVPVGVVPSADPVEDEEEELREAHMRQEIRRAQKEGFQRIAVVCGAWHAPVLEGGSARADAALLKGCTKIKVATTWIPWTNSRLSARSGYGAGINSPGWYEHLWESSSVVSVPSSGSRKNIDSRHPTRGKVYPPNPNESSGNAVHAPTPSIRWLTRAAHLLREQGLDASSASVIEAVRLSEALAALRSLSMPGLAELTEAIETVLCHGDATPMSLIREKLEIGERLGQVPAETPAVPLQRHLEERQRKLILKPSAEIKKLELDLRKETDRARSQLLHQLRLLGIHWGVPKEVRGKQSTFHEDWELQWRVDFVISLIEANVWGNTLDTAATAFVSHHADKLDDLPKMTELLDGAILAGLPNAIDHLLSQIQKRAAVSADIRHLMDALPPLARVARYSDVRQTRAEQVLPVIDGLFERILIGLPGACSSLDEDASQAMVGSIDNVHESVMLLNNEGQRDEWQKSLRTLAERETIHGFVRGRCCRLLLEQNVLDDDAFQRLTQLALSLVTPASQAAAWIEGVLRGSGLLMLHQDNLWKTLDHWLSNLSPDTFDALLPILRRAFSSFQPPERRRMGEKVKYLHRSDRGSQDADSSGSTQSINIDRAQKVLPILASIMGVKSYAS
jgi:Family of unknown function (DUF5682)